MTGIPGYTADVARASSVHYGAATTPPVPPGQMVVPALHWGEPKYDCVGYGVKRTSAVLWNIPWGQSWEKTCVKTPGFYNRVPDRCVNTGFNIWGEWDNPDVECCPRVCIWWTNRERCHHQRYGTLDNCKRLCRDGRYCKSQGAYYYCCQTTQVCAEYAHRC